MQLQDRGLTSVPHCHVVCIFSNCGVYIPQASYVTRGTRRINQSQAVSRSKDIESSDLRLRACHALRQSILLCYNDHRTCRSKARDPIRYHIVVLLII